MSMQQIDEAADKEYSEQYSNLPQCVIKSLKDDPDYVKCPRCWHYHTIKANHDCLCDRCSLTMIEHWPDHEEVPAIIASLETQKSMY